MHIRSTALAAILAATTITTTHATAQPITDSFTYQGTLIDNGAPASGTYDFSFIVYDSAVGGSIVSGGSTSVPNIEVVDGLFEAFIDFNVSGMVFDSDDTRWLEILVAPAGSQTFDILSPRQRITPAPLANYALRSGTSLQDAYNNGSVISMNSTQGVIELQSGASQNAGLFVTDDQGESRAILGRSGFDSGLLFLYGPANNPIITLNYDSSTNGGGRAVLTRNDSGDSGIVLEGNQLGSESSRVTISGVNSIIDLNTAVFSDDSVHIPTDSISARETLEEPGVAESVNVTQVNLTPSISTIDTIDSVTINAPTDGYVLIIGSAELSIGHTNGTSSSVNMGVSTSTGFIPGNQDLETRISLNNPTGAYDHAVTAHAIFTAQQGPNTYYFNADLRTPSATAAVVDSQLSAIFIPTAYGVAARDGGTNVPDELTPPSAPRTTLDILAEQNEALRADNERQQRELNEINAKLERLLQETAQEANLESKQHADQQFK